MSEVFYELIYKIKVKIDVRAIRCSPDGRTVGRTVVFYTVVILYSNIPN